ncbi:MAG TPA: hypothetical protein VFN10_17185 [Thermoanaerobaculia bacterium]|nr:hypothetical protein [Thermoanaerobaculia bacterium]
MKRTLVFLLMVLVSVAASAATNVLVNGGFELNPPATNGNNLHYPIAPWVLGNGSGYANVVQVDGPGGYSYGPSGNDGPESDASAPGGGIAQHYLDIVGTNSVYQVFAPRCTSRVTFGGAFSTRVDSDGSGSIGIYDGSQGAAGTLIASTTPVTLPGGNSATDPWTIVSNSLLLVAGNTYSFVVQMDDNLNLDNAFVMFDEECGAVDPCCPPFDTTSLEQMMVYQGTGGIAAPYTLAFQPTSLLQTQMQAYIDYLHTVQPTITQITIQFRLHDAGNGNTPGSGPQLGVSHYITWTAGMTNGGQPVPAFFSGSAETMLVNEWYIVHTGMYLENGQTFFPPTCADNDIAVRVQVQPLAKTPSVTSARAVLQMRDRFGRINEIPITQRAR